MEQQLDNDIIMHSSKKRKTDVEVLNESPKKDDSIVQNGVLYCHYCHDPDGKDRVVGCDRCRSNKYCVSCIAEWYPDVPEEEFVKACPVCCKTCICETCKGNSTNGWLSETESNVKDQEPAANEDSEKKTPNETRGLWRGLNVGPKAKDLLQSIEHHYPDTFKTVEFHTEGIWLHVLKHFYEVINGFLETPVDNLTEDQITKLDIQIKECNLFSFDLSWAHHRLDMVKMLKFGKPPLQQKLTVLDKSLQQVYEKVVEREKEYLEALEKLKESQFEYNEIAYGRKEVTQEMKNMFGDDYECVLHGNLGFGLLPVY